MNQHVQFMLQTFRRNLMKPFIFAILAAFVLSLSIAAGATTLTARWTGADDTNGAFAHVLQVANSKTGLKLATTDFLKTEDRDLANNHFAQYSQVASGLP